jgi:hypothetical protein
VPLFFGCCKKRKVSLRKVWSKVRRVIMVIIMIVFVSKDKTEIKLYSVLAPGSYSIFPLPFEKEQHSRLQLICCSFP